MAVAGKVLWHQKGLSHPSAVIFPLTQPQVANQQQKNANRLFFKFFVVLINKFFLDKNHTYKKLQLFAWCVQSLG